MSTMDRLGSRFGDTNNESAKDIYYKFKPGANRIRLVGSFVEVHTHYLAGNQKRNNRGLCPPSAFEGDNKIFTATSCFDWDVETEKSTDEHTCPICALRNLASKALGSGKLTTPEQKAFYEDLRSNTRVITQFRWNIIDRDDPYVTIKDNGQERKVLGLKIASMPYSVMSEIAKISKRLNCDPEDPDKGIDLVVDRKDNNSNVSYSVTPVYEGYSVKICPLTQEERQLEQHDLRKKYSNSPDAAKIRANLHGDLANMLDKYEQKYGIGKFAAQPAQPQQPVRTSAPAATQSATTVVTTVAPSAPNPPANSLEEIQAQANLEAGGSVLDQYPVVNEQVNEDVFGDILGN